MKSEIGKFLFSDNIWIEGNTGWFAPWNMGAIFEWDLDTNICHYIKEFPDFEFGGGIRNNSKCIKCGNCIFCFPCEGEGIWVYDLHMHTMEKIDIDNPSKKRIVMVDFWCNGNIIYALSKGLKQIFEIDVIEKKILCVHKLDIEENEILGGSVKLQNKLYIASATQAIIYEYDIDGSYEKRHHIPDINVGINRICYDGSSFWFSGRNKEIYLWDKENNVVQKLKDFPDGFGEYDFENLQEHIIDTKSFKFNNWLFAEMINTENYIWCIPYCSNMIIYVDKRTKETNFLRINEEEEDRISLSNHPYKYILQYYFDDRFIGLYSLKNKKILEIDVQKLSYKYKEIKLEEELKKLLNKYRDQNGILGENEYNIELFKLLLFDKNIEVEQSRNNVTPIGSEIYNKIKEY